MVQAGFVVRLLEAQQVVANALAVALQLAQAERRNVDARPFDRGQCRLMAIVAPARLRPQAGVPPPRAARRFSRSTRALQFLRQRN